MTNSKKGVLDRIEQSFVLFKNNFVVLFVPIFLYKLVSIVFFGGIATYYFISHIGSISEGSIDFFTILNDPYIITSIVVGVFLFLLYLLLYIPILLGLILSIKQSYNGEQVNIGDNLKYGFTHFGHSMKTYWYIFSYIALLPAIIFIIGGGLFNLGFYFPDFELGKYIGGGLMILSLFLFLIFALYRGIKAIFALYSAIDMNEFTKINFTHSITVTDNNWLRILGNFMLVGIIVGLLSSFISGVFGVFIPSSIDIEKIKGIDDLKSIGDSFSIIPHFISGFFSSVITIVGDVFIIVFTYIFFKRLEFENLKGTNKDEVEL